MLLPLDVLDLRLVWLRVMSPWCKGAAELSSVISPSPAPSRPNSTQLRLPRLYRRLSLGAFSKVLSSRASSSRCSIFPQFLCLCSQRKGTPPVPLPPGSFQSSCCRGANTFASYHAHEIRIQLRHLRVKISC